MKRVWHPYWNWEDWKAGMWRPVSGQEREDYLELAIEFTGDAELYGSWMLKVLDAWPIATEHNLTATNTNRKAWIGHAAVCLANGCPEDITRSAWGELTQAQQDAANAKAQDAIKIWESRYAGENNCVDSQVGESGIPQWHTG